MGTNSEPNKYDTNHDRAKLNITQARIDVISLNGTNTPYNLNLTLKSWLIFFMWQSYILAQKKNEWQFGMMLQKNKFFDKKYCHSKAEFMEAKNSYQRNYSCPYFCVLPSITIDILFFFLNTYMMRWWRKTATGSCEFWFWEFFFNKMIYFLIYVIVI